MDNLTNYFTEENDILYRRGEMKGMEKGFEKGMEKYRSPISLLYFSR